MKLSTRLSAIFISLAFIITSCSKTNNEGKMIPKTALAVIHLNTKSLSNKLSWNEIKQTSWFSELYNDADVAWAKKLMDNPDSTGIDFSSGLIFFVQKPGGTDGQVVLEGDIKNENDFAAFNKNLTGKTTSKDGDINILSLPDKVVVGWNDDKFVYVVSAAGITSKMKYPMDNQGNNNGSIDTTQNLVNICKGIFSLSDDNSLVKNEKFGQLFKEDGDIHVWQNTEEIAKSSAQLGALSMLKLDVFLKGNVSTATVNFDNGQISVKQKTYVSPELTDVLKKYFEGSINTDMIKHIPSENINGLLALHFKPEGIRELIKLTGMDGFANDFLMKNGLTLDDLVKANKGDILITATDFVLKKDSVNPRARGDDESPDFDETNSYSYERPDVNFLFSAGIGDKTAFNKLMSAFTKMLGEFGANQKIFYANDEKFFAVGSTQPYVSKYIGGNNNKFEFADKISGHPFAFFVDIQKILSTASSKPSSDSSANIIMDESRKIWQTAYCAGGEYKDDGFVLNTEVNFVDKNTNSLKQLNSYFDKIAKVMIEREKKNKERWQNDSTEVYPPMPMDTLPANP
jgi:hypothetical protein